MGLGQSLIRFLVQVNHEFLLQLHFYLRGRDWPSYVKSSLIRTCRTGLPVWLPKCWSGRRWIIVPATTEGGAAPTCGRHDYGRSIGQNCSYCSATRRLIVQCSTSVKPRPRTLPKKLLVIVLLAHVHRNVLLLYVAAK